MTTNFASRISRASMIGGAAIIALSVSASVSAAQQQLTAVQIEAGRTAAENARADQFEERARALYSSPRKFREAAQLHQRAAMIRGDDPRSAISYRSAAWVYDAAGDGGRATEMMVKAAEQSALSGRIEDAANSYIDAAFLAVSNSREDKVPALLARAHNVLSAPLLPEQDRAKIIGRITGDARVAHLDTQRPTAP